MNGKKRDSIDSSSGSPLKRKKTDIPHHYVSRDVCASNPYQGICEVIETKGDESDLETKLFACFFHKRNLPKSQFYLTPLKNNINGFLDYAEEKKSTAVCMVVTARDFHSIDQSDECLMATGNKGFPDEPFLVFIGKPETNLAGLVENEYSWGIRVAKLVENFMNKGISEKLRYPIQPFQVQVGSKSGKLCLNDLFLDSKDLWKGINLLWCIDDDEAVRQLLNCQNDLEICFGETAKVSEYEKKVWHLFRTFHDCI